MTAIKVVVPFRDRGTDPRRNANLDMVMKWWWTHGFNPAVVDDGLSDDAPFNRHRAYNRAVYRFPETDVYVFAEADMIIHPSQIIEAAVKAENKVGLVVPFTQYRYLDDETTDILRARAHMNSRHVAEWWARRPDDPDSIFATEPESVMDDGRSIGAVNVVSHETLRITGGFTELTHGNWYDDNIIEEAFAYLTGPTRWVDGPAVHLYHLPGWKGDHLSEADKRATQRNRSILVQMRTDIRLRQRESVKRLMAYREGVQA